MSHSVVVGIDGSAQSAAAAEWAALEARRNGLALRMVHVAGGEVDALDRDLGGGSALPGPVAAIRDRITAELPELALSCEIIPGNPAYSLAATTRRATMLVLGSRGLGGFADLLVGSVGLRAAARADCPVVLVRAGSDEGTRTDGPTAAPGAVVVGVEGDRPCDTVLAFAFQHAAGTGAALRVMESRDTFRGPYATAAPVDQREIRESLAAAEQVRLQDALTRWQDKFPTVRTEAEVCAWSASRMLVEASRTASLVVLGRRAPKHPMAGPRLGPVAQSVLHHAHGPVAVVPHD
ncbi:universal stress protein [Kitasatospora sp. CM 4170]|uniref:universal stress protein n=1 Tax=Kitasatospora TaxID=2063 RepID=UPI0028B16FD7|nr:universal stress protein [Kitasatospora sp. CM 4170]WNM43383.1 universal stress protein [Kitasatospora sp. CM 4170]